MKEFSPRQPKPEQPNPSQENWVSREEIWKLFRVKARTLKYWRSRKKVRFKVVGTRTYYIKSEIRRLALTRARTKMYFGIRKIFEKRLRRMETVLSMTILSVILGLCYIRPFSRKPVYSVREVYLPLVCVLCFAAIYGLLRLIFFLRKRIRRRKQSRD